MISNVMTSNGMASLIEATKESQMSRDPQHAEAPAREDRGLPRGEGYI
jgi:hypothetical protein